MFGHSKKSKEEKKKTKEQKKLEKKNKKENKKNKGNSKKGSKNKTNKNTNVKSSEKEKVPADVWLYRYMPFILLASVFLILVSGGISFKAIHDEKVRISKLSMSKGTDLSILSGSEDKGTLTLGRSIVSKDRTHMAVEIKYDDTAHHALSSFGKSYKLWLVTDEKYDASDVKIKYGFFGTDGVGVIQIYANRPLENKAFVIMLADKSKLATSNDLSTEAVDETTLDKSVTAQLANQDSDSSSMESEPKDEGTPIYYVRLNPYSAKKVDFNWSSEDEVKIVKELFINHNLAQNKKAIEKDEHKLVRAKKTLKEYQERLKENPNDEVAQQGVSEMQSSINDLNINIQTAKENRENLLNYKIKNNILGRQQNKYHLLQTDDFANLN